MEDNRRGGINFLKSGLLERRDPAHLSALLASSKIRRGQCHVIQLYIQSQEVFSMVVNKIFLVKIKLEKYQRKSL